MGGLHSYLLKISTSETYNRIKNRVWDMIGSSKLRRGVQKFMFSTKMAILKSGSLFESFGFRYFGAIDGNDIGQLTTTLASLRNIKGPKLLHVITKKGKGYRPAEQDQTVWHAPGTFDPLTGKRNIPASGTAARYQDVFGETLLELARADRKIVAVTPAMASGCGMSIMMKEIPERTFDVGIAEQHAVTFSAGLAAAGYLPFCNIYSSFMQRAYDSVIHDVALQKLKVILCLDRAGLVGEDGATHHGVFDMAAFRPIPNLIIASPLNELELRNLLYTDKVSPGHRRRHTLAQRQLHAHPDRKGPAYTQRKRYRHTHHRADRKPRCRSSRQSSRTRHISPPLRHALSQASRRGHHEGRVLQGFQNHHR